MNKRDIYKILVTGPPILREEIYYESYEGALDDILKEIRNF